MSKWGQASSDMSSQPTQNEVPANINYVEYWFFYVEISIKSTYSNAFLNLRRHYTMKLDAQS